MHISLVLPNLNALSTLLFCVVVNLALFRLVIYRGNSIFKLR